MAVSAGDTFLGHAGQLQIQTAHLWIVVHVDNSGLDTSAIAVMVNVTSWTGHGDGACILNPGDHSFINQRSYIYYRQALEVSVTDIEQLVMKQQMQKRVPVSQELLARVRQGLHASKFTPRRLKGIVPR